MGKKHVLRNEQSEQTLCYLLCDSSGLAEPKPHNGAIVQSPIQCLDKAVDGKLAIIAVRFKQLLIGERATLVELCATLKRNRHTRNIPILALLHVRHRKLLEDLGCAGVDFAKFIGDTTLSSSRMIKMTDGLGPEDRVERQLAKLCRYLHYNALDACHEMRVCGAYLDRMVLGGKWLHEVCETENHLSCEYFLNPRSQS